MRSVRRHLCSAGRPSYIIAAKRTPIASIGGSLASYRGPELAGFVGRECLKSANIGPENVDAAIFGNVCSAGVGQAPARQAALASGCDESTPSTAVNKVCASGMKAAMFASQAVQLGQSNCVLTGGFESMSNVPYYIPKARSGYKYGHGTLEDGLIKDGLWDSFDDHHMGACAELCATEYDISREDQDNHAIESYKRALYATEHDLFYDEIVPVPHKKTKELFEDDEEPTRVKFDKIPSLRSAFKKDGSVTAANSSSLNDGAAAMLVANEFFIKDMDIQPLARIVAYTDVAKKPSEFTTAPALAIQRLMEMTGIQISNVDLFEINEAFSVVALANQKILGLDPDTVNVNGGAVALGHPIGCSGARIVVSLIHALQQKNKMLGCAAICNGGGGASAILIERLV